jgi:hypothetical protein
MHVYATGKFQSFLPDVFKFEQQRRSPMSGSDVCLRGKNFLGVGKERERDVTLTLFD